MNLLNPLEFNIKVVHRSTTWDFYHLHNERKQKLKHAFNSMRINKILTRFLMVIPLDKNALSVISIPATDTRLFNMIYLNESENI